MKLRFQIGSKSPLANRNARMFCAASLPRKWSIRNTWDSSKASCTKPLSWTALGKSCPNGFSITTRAFSARSASRSMVITDAAALGGTER